jgi:hypothetical protein
MRPEVDALLVRGNVTLSEIKALRCNSWEWQALIPKLDDEAFQFMLEQALRNCSRIRAPATTYDEAVIGAYAPELLRRWLLSRLREKR